MPPKTATLFLGLELATDQLRASIVDENLELVGVEAVDFDSELPEFQTQGGIFTTPGEAYTTPVEMWVKAFDVLMEKLSKSHDLTKIGAIGGAAQQALVWWKTTPISPLQNLDPRLPIHPQVPSQSFSLPNAAIAQDTSAHTHALSLEAALGGPEHMADRVGICAHASLIAAQLLRVREAWPDIWQRTGRVQMASAFLASLVIGGWAITGESEACATGLWTHGGTSGSTASNIQSHWDENILEIVGGNRDEAERMWNWLGDVDTSGGRKKIGNVSRYLVDRYGFDPGTTFLVNADVPRALVRDMYTKSWSAFDRLVAIVPPGGSIGLDDKLFSYWLLQSDSYPVGHVKGIFRFETGVKVNEFRDLRANPRCLIESQVLSFRVRWSRMVASGVLGPNTTRNRTTTATASPISGQAKRPAGAPSPNNMGLPFDPYDYVPLPGRIIATGAATNFPSIANLVGDIFNTPVLVPTTQIDAAQVAPHRNAPATGFPARAALGGAYVARWVWGKEKGTSAGTGRGGFEEEVRRLMSKRWTATGGTPLRTNANAPGVASKVGSATNSGASTPYGHGGRSGLGANVLVEVDEEDIDDIDVRLNATSGFGLGIGGAFNENDLTGNGRLRTFTSSSVASALSGATAVDSPSTAFTTPDVGSSSPGASGIDADIAAAAAAGPSALTPVVALPSTEAETVMGLAKVAEPDVDAFMSYAAIVPEYCRLEGMLVKGLV
ncbi:hypothetical protein EUX98_g2932 [Antrodiella citrinella]|uniref:Carbohydrate kinase FGGY N-terminal domain-containing protein n=1 Tax=Antrodiella citrinella TaxID=2447956 RepID=A0A4V3XJ12_9APHY|nr:hypothetical protein EUX98_g2932 [Antrodiella citrinella]